MRTNKTVYCIVLYFHVNTIAIREYRESQTAYKNSKYN